MEYLTAFGIGVVTILALIRFYAKVTWKSFKEDVDMTGKTAIVTGANGGLGKAVAVEFAKRNARVILACRSLIRGEAARMEIVADSGCEESNVVLKTLDLSSFQSVREFANHVVNNEERLDILVNNAAIFGKPIIKTKDKMDLTYQTNHFGPFLLTNLLLDLLKRSGPGSRIINVSSFMHDMCALDLDYLKPDDFGVFCATKQTGRWKRKPEILLYNNSKLMNIMFTRELARRLGDSGVTTNCLSPGIVRTNILASDKRIIVMIVMIFMLVVSKNTKEGCQTMLHCALSRSLKSVSGKYFTNCQEDAGVHEVAQDDDACKKLWELSELYTGICAKPEQ